MNKKYNVPGDFSSLTGYNSLEEYLKLKTDVHTDNEAYWAKVAERIDWFEKWTDVKIKNDNSIIRNLLVKYNKLDTDNEYFKQFKKWREKIKNFKKKVLVL